MNLFQTFLLVFTLLSTHCLASSGTHQLTSLRGVQTAEQQSPSLKTGISRVLNVTDDDDAVTSVVVKDDEEDEHEGHDHGGSHAHDSHDDHGHGEESLE